MSACSGLQATPDSYCAAFTAFVRRISTPWLPPPTPGSHISFQGSLGFSAVFPLSIRWLSTFRFPRPRHEPLHCFLFTLAAEVRLLTRSASYPCSFSGIEQCLRAATYPAPGSYSIHAGVLLAFPDFVSVPRQIPSPCGSSGFVGHLRNL